jgi:hypothetical protein
MPGYVYKGTVTPEPEPPPKPPRKPGSGRPRSSLAPCGTTTAYARHKRRGEPLDEACRQANIDYCANRRKAQQ